MAIFWSLDGEKYFDLCSLNSFRSPLNGGLKCATYLFILPQFQTDCKKVKEILLCGVHGQSGGLCF